MGLISGLLGNASEVDSEKLEATLVDVLFDGEHVLQTFKLVRDLIVLTDSRLIVVDKQGVTGKKVEYHSIPYRSVSHFAVETCGHFELDSELKIWIGSDPEPMKIEFKRGADIRQIQKTLAQQVMG